MKRNILVLGLGAGAAAVSMLALAATPALAAEATTTTTTTTAAATPNSFISAPTGLHNAPSLSAPAGATLQAGKPVYAFCFVPNGEKVQGNSTWIRISVDDTMRGFVPKAAIGGVPALPQC